MVNFCDEKNCNQEQKRKELKTIPTHTIPNQIRSNTEIQSSNVFISNILRIQKVRFRSNIKFSNFLDNIFHGTKESKP